MQGTTLRPLIRALDIYDDDPVGREVDAARARPLEAARGIKARTTSAAGGHAFHRLEQEFGWVEMGIGVPDRG